LQIVSGGVTNVGRVRANNEDCFRIVEPLNLFVLSDGMGGEAHGEIASALAVETIVKHCMAPAAPEDKDDTVVFGDMPAAWSEKTRRLSNAVHLANKAIHESAEKNPEQHGMGATVTAIWVDDAKLSLAHVGDSRAYLLRSGSLQQLTNDHSLVAEQVRRGILTPAEAERSALFGRDVLLLCSDGLTRMVTEPEIAGTLQSEPDPAKAAEKLVNLANEQGGADNITVVVARVDMESKGWFSWLRRGTRKESAANGSAGGK